MYSTYPSNYNNKVPSLVFHHSSLVDRQRDYGLPTFVLASFIYQRYGKLCFTEADQRY